MAKVLVFTETLDDMVADVSFELLDLGRRLAQGGELVAFLCGQESALAELGAADRALLSEVSGYSPDCLANALALAIGREDPDLVLVGNTAIGMDVGTFAAAKSGYHSLAYVQSVASANDGELVATSLILGGKMIAGAHVEPRTVLQMLPGSSNGESGHVQGPPARVERLESPPGRVDFEGFTLPEAGDIDITRHDVLVSIGRGIGDASNIDLATELAEALGGVVTSSRPVVDAGWLPKARQVGKSGSRVKPRLYLALGISGAPEHLEGMRDADCIVAVNTDPTAPIFEVAHYGIVEDILEFMPQLAEAIREQKD